MHETRTPEVSSTAAGAPRRQAQGAAPEVTARQVSHPAALAGLQRTVGNAAVTRWVQRQEDLGAREEARRNAADPTLHGEWGDFRVTMAQAGFPDGVTNDAWQLILGGIAEQGQLNDEAMATYAGCQDRRDHRASNTWYQDLVKLIGNYLKIDTPTLALWSGGREVSDYALAKGHTPLEATPFGGVVDKLTLTSDWMLKTPMWNVLSKAFVNRARGPVHIFLRTYNPDSVLISQEVPQLRVVMALNPEVRLIWHPVYAAADGTLREVTKRLELTSDSTYPTRDACVRVLDDYLRLIHDPANAHSQKAHLEMSARLAANGNPQEH
ncbi:hypothetical protein ACFZCG_19680 [Streptomyces tanashiensis]|uniref:hypothetical protein n=1 Tax=Streptomyces tanashiensis TaxID=67367 RepID=UPI0036E5BF63